MAVVVVFDPRDGYTGGRPKYLVLLTGAAAAAVLLVAAGALTAWRRNPLRRPVLALVVWTAVSAALSPYPRTALFGDAGSRRGVAAGRDPRPASGREPSAGGPSAVERAS